VLVTLSTHIFNNYCGTTAICVYFKNLDMLKNYKHTLYILILGLTLQLAACSSDDSKQALRQSLNELITAVEQKKHRAVTQKLTSNFQGNKRFNQQTMSALIFRYYIRYRFIKIYSLINSIKIEPGNESSSDSKLAKMTFHVALTSSKNALPEHMRVFKVDSHWIRIDKEWKILKADWLEVRPQSVYPQIKQQIISWQTN